jgi:hypothetical protein
MGQEIEAEQAPRVFGSLSVGLNRTPFTVTRCEVEVKGLYLRAMVPGADLKVGNKVQIDPPGMPAQEFVIIDHVYGESDAHDDRYILDWRTSRQPRAIPVQD